MYFLELTCIAFIATCILNPDPVPPTKREFATYSQCDRELIAVAHKWRPAQGAWTMNCVRR